MFVKNRLKARRLKVKGERQAEGKKAEGLKH